jgi:hypothetical protein
MRTAILIIIALTMISVLCAFPKGKINPGGTISYSSYKLNNDADAISTIQIAPQVGYFFIDKLSGDIMIDYTN